MKLTEGAVRYAARKHGVSVSKRQWDGYRKWKLIPDEDSDGWEPEIVARLIEVAALGETVRSLPRRLLRLNDARYPRAPGLTRRAMQRIIPTMKQPVRKSQRMHRAWALWSFGPHSLARRVRSRELPQVSSPNEWARALDAVPDEQLGRIVQSASYFAAALGATVRGSKDAIDNIPPEEQLILLTVTDAIAFLGDRTEGEAIQAT